MTPIPALLQLKLLVADSQPFPADFFVENIFKRAANSSYLKDEERRQLGAAYFDILDTGKKLHTTRTPSISSIEHQLAEQLLNLATSEYPENLTESAQQVASTHGLAPAKVALAVGDILLSKAEHGNDPALMRKALYFLCEHAQISSMTSLVGCVQENNPWVSLPMRISSDPYNNGIPVTSNSLLESAQGRVIGIRRMKKTSFIDLDQQQAKPLQVVLDNLRFNELADSLKVGDYLCVYGNHGMTRTGHHSFIAEGVSQYIQSAAVSPETHIQSWQEQFEKASACKILTDVFNDAGFLSVRTPILTDTYQGGNARPFSTYQNATGTTQYMKVTSELEMIKFIAGGAQRIFEFTSSFRNEGLHGRRRAEFQFFEAYSTSHTMTDMCDFLTQAIEKVSGRPAVTPIVEFGTVFQQTLGFDYKDEERCKQLLADRNIELDAVSTSPSEIAKKIFYSQVAPCLPDICFLAKPPSVGSPLIEGDREEAQRLWLFVCGTEVAEVAENARDHNLVRDKLAVQFADSNVAARRDYSGFLSSLAMGLPRTVGVGVGVDRFVQAAKRYGQAQKP